MWTHGQRLQRHEVEKWISDKYPYPFFLVSIDPKEEPERSQVRMIITVTGPNGESLSLDNERRAVYYSTIALPGMPQITEDWTV